MVFPILYNGLPLSFLPLKIAPSCGGSGFPSNTWYLGTTWVHNPNSISICSAILQDSTSCRQTQTNRETAHTTPSVITVLQCGPKREIQLLCGVLWCIKLINISRFTSLQSNSYCWKPSRLFWLLTAKADISVKTYMHYKYSYNKCTGAPTHPHMIQPQRDDFVHRSGINQLAINGIESPECGHYKLSNKKYIAVSKHFIISVNIEHFGTQTTHFWKGNDSCTKLMLSNLCNLIYN